MMAPTTARTINPRTSSTTAAARMVRPSCVWTLPRSFKTRADIPTLVAQSVAPRNTSTQRDKYGKNIRTMAKPSRNGAITPMMATMRADRPTANNLGTVLSTPTSNINSITPNSAKVAKLGSVLNASKKPNPKRAMFPRTIPANSSPKTTGRRTLRAARPPSLAAVKIKESSNSNCVNECGIEKNEKIPLEMERV